MIKKGLGSIPKSLAWLDPEANEATNNTDLIPVAQTNSKPSQSPLVVTAVEGPSKQGRKSTQQGLPSGWTRATFIIQEDLNKKIKALAYWERKTVKDIMHEALSLFMQGKDIKLKREADR